MDRWLVTQIGARENYSIAAALHQNERLGMLLTDLWYKPGNLWDKLVAIRVKSFANRRSSLVPDSLVKSMPFGLYHKSSKQAHEYERLAKAFFRKCLAKRTNTYSHVFAYNYSAVELFREAKLQGKKCVLGQVDAGPVAGEIITELYKKEGIDLSNRRDYYQKYGKLWKEECQLADTILVNSLWSKTCLVNAGVEEGKIKIVPLAYDSCEESPNKVYPNQFTQQRPMRVLYAGRVSVQKGCLEIIRAAKQLSGHPVEFILAGEWKLANEWRHQLPDNVKVLGRVSSETLVSEYKVADVFLFPTYTDGFGKVLLEAQEYKLPIISSPFCGDVVKHGVTGVKMNGNSADEIIKVLGEILHDTKTLRMFSEQMVRSNEYTLQSLGHTLSKL